MHLFGLMRRRATAIALVLLTGCASGTTAVPLGALSHGVGNDATSSSGEILYVGQEGKVAMLTYPGLKPIGRFKYPSESDEGFQEGCPDNSTGSTYFISNLHVRHGGLFEYADGGTTLIKYLTPPKDYSAVSCSVDPVSGNLAVVLGIFGQSKPTKVAIYAPGGERPTATFEYPHLRWYASCAYDGGGNLFVVGETTQYRGLLLELPKDGSGLRDIHLGASLGDDTFVQWDGLHIAIESWGINEKHPGRLLTVYRLAISGSKATVIGKTVPYYAARAVWIDGPNRLITGRFCRNNSGCSMHLGFYDYPAGGKATSVFRGIHYGGQILTLTVASPASGARSRIRRS